MKNDGGFITTGWFFIILFVVLVGMCGLVNFGQGDDSPCKFQKDHNGKMVVVCI